MNNTVRKVLLAAVIAFVFWWNFPGLFGSALIFVAALSVLVAFHEAGHFLAAKACGVYVDRFSIGMPPRLFGVRWGETDYCIGALPLGGYVKMAGQEDAPRSEEEQEADYAEVPPDRWFSNKPVWQRLIILVAGPAANVVLAALIYGIVAIVGAEVEEQRLEARIGLVESGAPAETAPLYAWPEGADRPSMTGTPEAIGWRTGDRIVSVNGRSMTNMIEVAQTAMFRADEQVEVVVERPGPDGITGRFISPVTPAVLDDDMPFPRFGVAPFQTVFITGVVQGSPADEAGLLPGDIIRTARGEIVDIVTFTQAVERTPEGETLDVTVERGAEILTLALAPQIVGSVTGLAFTGASDPFAVLRSGEPRLLEPLVGASVPAQSRVVSINGNEAAVDALEAAFREETTATVAAVFEDPRGRSLEARVSAARLLSALTGVDEESQPVITRVGNSVRESHGLLPQDVIAAVNGVPATPGIVRAVLDERIGEEITLDIHRPAIGGGVLRVEDRFSVTLPVVASGKVGVTMGPRFVYHRFPVAQVPSRIIHEMQGDFTLMYETLTGLVTARVSPRELGGPIMIAQVTTTMAQRGWVWLFEITALISINLAVINLLPLPVLDGGQVVLNLIEGIRRKPIDLRVQEKIQYVGVLLILALMIAVTFNDVSRIITGFIPR